MNQQTNILDLQPQTTPNARSTLDEIVREGARPMLQAAIEEEVATFIKAHQDLRDEYGYRLVVRNGHLPEREVLTGAGPLTVKKPSCSADGRARRSPARSYRPTCAARPASTR